MTPLFIYYKMLAKCEPNKAFSVHLTVCCYFTMQNQINKKSELMLMRRARAYGSLCSQVILVYLHPFRRNSLFCSQTSPKNH